MPAVNVRSVWAGEPDRSEQQEKLGIGASLRRRECRGGRRQPAEGGGKRGAACACVCRSSLPRTRRRPREGGERVRAGGGGACGTPTRTWLPRAQRELRKIIRENSECSSLWHLRHPRTSCHLILTSALQGIVLIPILLMRNSALREVPPPPEVPLPVSAAGEWSVPPLGPGTTCCSAPCRPRWPGGAV